MERPNQSCVKTWKHKVMWLMVVGQLAGCSHATLHCVSAGKRCALVICNGREHHLLPVGRADSLSVCLFPL